jgi:hypothetical protein
VFQIGALALDCGVPHARSRREEGDAVNARGRPMTEKVGHVVKTSSGAVERVLKIGFQSVDRLGRALFEKQEQMLPNDEVWEELSEADRTFWIVSATTILRELRKIAKEQGEE